MFDVDSNIKEVLEKYRRTILRALASGAHPDVADLMKSGIQSHFNRLSAGGGNDPTALGPGTGLENVSWLVGDRHRFTVASHRLLGVDPNQLLILTGSMRDSFTTNARVDQFRSHAASFSILQGSNPNDVMKAQVNLGGQQSVDFPHLGIRNVVVNVPRRQFVYWDTLMRMAVEKLAIREAEQEWSK